jgi:hypothetical protein
MIGNRHVSDPGWSISGSACVRATIEKTIASATVPRGCTVRMSRGRLLAVGQQQGSGAVAARLVIEAEGR